MSYNREDTNILLAEYCIAADGAANRIFEIYKNSNEFQNNVWKDFVCSIQQIGLFHLIFYSI